MREWFRKQSGPEKLVAISAAGLLVGLGLCGAATQLPAAAQNVLLGIGALSFWTSVLGMIIGVCLLILAPLFDGHQK